jgi:hypothetical protein
MSQPGYSLNRKEGTHTPGSFWQWFSKNQDHFDQLNETNAEEAPARLNEIVEELKKYDPWFKALLGKYDDTSSELVITADGDIALFVKVEQFIEQAPALTGWRFTAHKPPLGFDEISIEMHGKTFSVDTVNFYPLIDPVYPDRVSIVFTHNEYDESKAEDFQTAASIYIQNALGELNTATEIDHYDIRSEPGDKSIMIPVAKLNDYLTWRAKEFVEKYDHASIKLPEELFYTIEGQDASGNIMMAIAVASYEHWDYKPVYCWWIRIEMEYAEAENGLPAPGTLQLLQDTEEKAVQLLTRQAGIIYTASKTFRGCRTIYFYAKNYRDSSLLLYDFCEKAGGELELGFFIEKDKYWQNMEEFFGLEVEEDSGEDEEQ